MKIPLKYGLIAALGLIIWVLATRRLFPNPQSTVHAFGTPVFFNVIHFAVIFLGLKALEREQGDKPRFKDALKTGVAIALVYALTAALFFVGVLSVVGTKWMASGPDAATTPTGVLLAFAGLVLLTMLFGLIYSTVIAFFVSRRQSELTD
jgi:uncharacterized membrane protein